MAFTKNSTSPVAFIPVCKGRSGYNNKPEGEDEDTTNKGRSGYNKGDKDDEEE